MRDVSSVVEHLPYKQMAIGSNPIHPIKFCPLRLMTKNLWLKLITNILTLEESFYPTNYLKLSCIG